MKRLLQAFIIALGLTFSVAHADVIKTVQAGAVDQTVTVRIIDSTDGTPETGVVFNTSGIDLEYWRHGANAAVDITEVTQTVNGAHSDGGFVHIGHGVYRLDLPDAAVATGATAVEVFGTVTGMIVIGGTVDLSPPANVVSFGGTAGTFASGRPEVNTSHWGGTAVGSANVRSNIIQINSSALSTSTAQLGVNVVNVGGSAVSATGGLINTNVAQVSGDSAVADRLEAMLDSTCGSYPEWGIARGVCTAQSATATTLVLDSSASFADDTPIGMTLVACGSTQGYCQAKTIVDYVGSTDTATVDTWTVTPSGTITYTLYSTAPGSASGGASAAEVWAYGSRTLTELDEDTTTIDLNTSAVGSVAGAVGSVTGNVGGNVTGSVGSVATGGITAASVATGAIDADALAADAGTEIGTAVWATTTRSLTILDEDSTTIDLNATTVGGLTNGVTVTTNNDKTGYALSTTGLDSTGWPSAWDAEVQSEAADALTAYDPPTNAELTSALAALNDLSADEIRDLIIDDQGSVSLGCGIAAILATVAGDVSTSGGTSTFEDASGTETRVVSVVVSAGNRTTTITCPTY